MLFGEKDYTVYLLSNTCNINRTYLGITNNLSKTLKEHNQNSEKKKNSPKYTKIHKNNGEWFCSLEIKNLSKSEAIKIEREVKCRRRGDNSQSALEKRLNIIKPILKYYPNCQIIQSNKRISALQLK